MMTHENEDSIGIFLPAVGHLIVFFLCSLRIQGEEGPRAVAKVGFPLRWSWLLILWLVVAIISCTRW
jgi:hypothetical protein